MSDWNRTTPPNWSPLAVPSTAGWLDPLTGELLIAMAIPPAISHSAATITDVKIAKNRKTFRTGDTVDIQVTFSEAVVVTGAVRFPMTLNGSVVYASYNSGSGTPLLHFTYVVDEADSVAAGSFKIGVAAVAASRTYGTGNSQLKLTAKTAGTAGNSITLAIVNPGTNNASLSVGVVSSAITVNLATNGSAAATSTVTQVIAAIAASGAADALVTATSGTGDGTGVPATVTATALSGGTAIANNSVDLNSGHVYDLANFATLTKGTSNTQLVFTAVKPGTYGNLVSVAIVNPGTNNATLSIGVSGNAITVNLATNGSAVATSTVNQVITAIQASELASNLVTVDTGVGNGTGLLAAAAVASLSGGTDSASTTASTLTFSVLNTSTVTLN